MTLSFGTGSGSKATPAMPPSAPTATVAAVIRPITLSRLLLKYSAEDFTAAWSAARSAARSAGWSAAESAACSLVTPVGARSGRIVGATGSAAATGSSTATPAGTARIPMADLAWRELERTEVPHTTQNDALLSSMFSHSGQNVSANVERLSSEPSPLAAASTAASSSASCSIIRILMTRTARIAKPQIRPSALPNGR